MIRPLAAVVVVVLMALSACSDDAATTLAGDEVIFGEGEPPPAFPSDFPVPASAVIGTTLIDPFNHRSEMALQIDANLVAAVQYFTIGLVSQGFIVTSSEGTAYSWTLEYSRGEVSGDIVFQAVGNLTQAVASVNGT